MNPNLPRSLRRHQGATTGQDFKVAIIGAGNVNFGSDEGPWNISLRLEQKLGSRLKVVALIEPSVERSVAVLKKKCESSVAPAYQDTQTFKNIDEFAASQISPQAIIIGAPPAFRGSDLPGKDMELQLLKYFPGVALFVEKPVAAGSVEKAFAVAEKVEKSGSVCSVGYMLRYLKAVQFMKKIIEDNKLIVMATHARYACAYEAILKPDWWNKAISCGPVVEQGTHFCDLSRYFGGDVDISTVAAHALEWDEDPGRLTKVGIDETMIPPDQRIPRATTATWKYDNGAVGSFIHLVSLQGSNYSCEFEIYLDGYLLKLVDPYNKPTLYVRRPGDDQEEVHRFEDDDPFFTEISTIIDVIDLGAERANILSTYTDACKTYEFTWAIRDASERGRSTF